MTPSVVVVPGDSLWPKIDSLMSRAELVVADIANRAALSELMSNRSKIIGRRLCVIVDETLQQRIELTADLGNLVYINRLRDLFGEGGDAFVARLNDWFALSAADTRPRLEEEPARLLKAKEYRTAIIAAISVLEKRLRERLSQRRFHTKKSFATNPMIDEAVQEAIITPQQREQLKQGSELEMWQSTWQGTLTLRRQPKLSTEWLRCSNRSGRNCFVSQIGRTDDP